MNAEFFTALDLLEKEKGIPASYMIEKIEAALTAAYKKEYGNMTLTLFIDCDKEGGVGLDDCEAVSRAVEPILDEADPTGGAPYHLNVSSPGLDRPIKTERDFFKKQGTKVEALFYAPKDGTKRVEGTLTGWSEDRKSVV